MRNASHKKAQEAQKEHKKTGGLNAKFSLCLLSLLSLFVVTDCFANPRPGKRVSFNRDWRFQLGNLTNGQWAALDDSQWRHLDLPHDWSIEGEFSKDHPSGTGGGALPGGIGWYRKTFTVPLAQSGKQIFIEFDGVYMNSEVYLNGQSL